MMKPPIDELEKPLTLDELMRDAGPAADQAGPRFWRSLSELADDGSFDEQAKRAAARAQAAIYGLDEASRRKFMTVMGASFALSGVVGCGVQPAEKIVPYVEQPEAVVPGKPLFFATASPMGGDGLGLLVESQMGRPTKVEGNPSHPASGGATDVFAQAEVLSLYDPDRSQVVVHDGRVDTWERFLRFAVDLREQKLATKGRGLRFLTRSVSSPTLVHQFRRLQEALPEAKWVSYEPVTRDAARKGAELAFGKAFEADYRFDKADVVVALDADFLCWGPAGVRHARAFIERRTAEGEGATMSRLYAFEPTPTVTGAKADDRTPVASAEVLLVAAALAKALKVAGAPDLDAKRIEAHSAKIAALAAELEANKGKALVVVGDTQPAEVHALGHAINAALGAIGTTLVLSPPADAGPADQIGSLVELARDVEAGEVDTLLVLGANPVYEAPADLKMGEVLRNPKLTTLVHLGQYNDETGSISHWHLPEAHFLESWGDVRSSDGTVALIQPLIEPLYQGRSASEVLSALLGEVGVPGREIVRNYWRGRLPAATFEQSWRRALRDGVVQLPGEGPKPETPGEPKLDAVKWPTVAPASADELEVVFRPDPTIWDGRYANNGWLQELPKPLTTLTWENAALVSPALARRMNLREGQVVVLEFRSTSIEGVPVLINPGQAENSVTVHLGYGRQVPHMKVGHGIGFDANRLRRSDALWASAGLAIHPTSQSVPVPITQHHHRMEGRDILRVEKFGEKPHHHEHPSGSLIPEWPGGQQHEDYAWSMAIDLNRCIGCSACTIACQAENNIPVVGKAQVLNSREMHWIRVDRYYEGTEEDPDIHFQPVPCMHCEKAPCELVCPVEATSHSDEGLNEMTYNRCVGTRYCGNNCPYKVRRFNFLQYADKTTPSLQLLNNPDVTVRMRGVMEKCTYCVQRINEARINAKMAGGKVGPDEVVTACQAACPTKAIVFGNLKDPESAVSKLRKSERHYALLGELGTLPRTTYLSKVVNPAGESGAKGEAHEEPHHG